MSDRLRLPVHTLHVAAVETKAAHGNPQQSTVSRNSAYISRVLLRFNEQDDPSRAPRHVLVHDVNAGCYIHV